MDERDASKQDPRGKGSAGHTDMAVISWLGSHHSQLPKRKKKKNRKEHSIVLFINELNSVWLRWEARQVDKNGGKVISASKLKSRKF